MLVRKKVAPPVRIRSMRNATAQTLLVIDYISFVDDSNLE